MKEKLTRIFNESLLKNGEDLHIEPLSNSTRIRLRIFGELTELANYPKAEHQALIATLKVMGGLDIGESRLPQDGKSSFDCNGAKYDLRISTIPTIYGEKGVVRFLKRDRVAFSLEEIGFTESILQHYRKIIRMKSGLFLVVGPTGGGKTTTLYATLNELNDGEKNIISIEDPVEYTIDGIVQVQVNEKIGLTFGKILRSTLRQDPDIILVGEIRDSETANVAVQASLTGHLVFATIHAKNCDGGIKRLHDLGVKNYFLEEVLLGGLSQRLVRAKNGRKAVFEMVSYLGGRKELSSFHESGMALVQKGEILMKDLIEEIGEMCHGELAEPSFDRLRMT